MKIIPKEITASKSSGAAKEEEYTGVGDEKGEEAARYERQGVAGG